MTKFLQYLWNLQANLEKTSAKNIEVYISRRTIFSAFHYFFRREYSVYTSEVNAILDDSHVTFIGNFFIISCLV